METTTVNVRRVDPYAPDGSGAAAGAVPTLSELEADLARARMLANWLDAKFSVAGIRFGLDSIIGLIPGVGDTVTSLIGLYPLWVARRHNLGRTVQGRMFFNTLVDWAGGLIPLAGDVLDVAYKANLKNLKLLEKAAEKRLRKEKPGYTPPPAQP